MTTTTTLSGLNFWYCQPSSWPFWSITRLHSLRWEPLCQNRQSPRHSISSACDKHNLTFQVLWTFSIYLESVAILPQLFMVSKTGEAESITSHYLFALGSYRALYILNWIYRYATEVHYDLIAIVAGIVQTVLYCDFFYLYVTKGELFFFCRSI